MAEFSTIYKTTRVGRSGHYHLAYLRPDGTGFTSDKGHTHPVVFRQAVSEEEETRWDIGEVNGHTHEIEGEVQPKPKDPGEKDEEIAQDVLELYKASNEDEADFRKKGKESEDFYANEQWDKNDKRLMEAAKRPALTINEIEGKIDLISGYQRQNRLDIRYLPTEGGDARVADILTILVKNISEQSNYDYEETEVFEDAAIAGRGNIHSYVDYDSNLDGDIKIEQFPWDEIWYGPHNKKDGSDAEYLIKGKWYSLAKIKQMWPDKYEKIEKTFEFITDDGSVHLRVEGDQYSQSQGVKGWIVPELVDIARKEFRVLECWRKEYKLVEILVNVQDDKYISTEDWSKEDISAAKTIPGFTPVTRKKEKIRVTKASGGAMLEDFYSELFEDSFSVIPLYAKKRKNKVWGKVEALKDPQREINKRHSQVSDIINKVAAYGWFYDATTFPNETEKNKFKKISATPGFEQEVSDTNRIPVKVEGVKFPNELVAYEEICSSKMKEISNINIEMSGQEGNAKSGVAIMEKKRSGLLGNEFLYDNLGLMKRALGRTLVRLIQKVYTPERIARIIETRAARPEEANTQIGGQPASQYSREEIVDMLKTTDLIKHDVVVAENPNSPSARLFAFAVWSELARGGLPVPPEYLADLSDAPNKEKLIQGMQQMQQMAAQAEQGKQQTEIVKTQIAHAAKQQGKPVP